MTIQTFIKRYAVLTYYVLTFVISWGGVLLVSGGPSGIPASTEEAARLLGIGVLAMLVGPSVTGILMIRLVYGVAGLHDFLSRLLKWQVSVRWYAVVILATPLLLMVTLLALALTSPTFLPAIFVTEDKVSLLLTGIMVGLAAGIFEEIGWTGFAIPRLRQHYGVLTTGLIVGFLWGAWHYMVAFWGSGDATGAFSWMLFLPQMLFYVGVLPAYRVLMVWVYDHTESLLMAMLMHASLTGSVLFIFMPPALAGLPLMTWYLVLTAALWGIVAAVVVKRQQANPPETHLPRQGGAQLRPR